MTRRTRTAISTGWWGRELSPGRAVRRVAAAGGSMANGFINGVGALWALPGNRRRRRGRKAYRVRGR